MTFTAYELSDLASLAPYFVGSKDRCGIYILHFSDGAAYVGKTSNVVSRFNQHRRDWDDKRPGVPITKVEFAPCPVDQLDGAEVAIIRQLERTHTLRNTLLTNKPGGHGDIEINHKNAPPFRIPAVRADRPRLAATEPSDQLRRVANFLRDPAAQALVEFVGVYLAESMPSPAETAGSMWTCTALPSTAGGSRLFTLNTGTLETLYAHQTMDAMGNEHTWIVINIAIPENRSVADLTVKTSICEAKLGNYRGEDVWTWTLNLDHLINKHDGVLDEILESRFKYSDELFDLAYELNRRLMARRPSMWIRNHNEYLAAHFLAEAVIADCIEVEQQKSTDGV